MTPQNADVSVCASVSDTCSCSHVCSVYVLSWWQWGEVDLMSVLKPRSGSCSTVRWEVVVHVVYMTLCLSGFRAVLSIPSLVSASGPVAVGGIFPENVFWENDIRKQVNLMLDDYGIDLLQCLEMHLSFFFYLRSHRLFRSCPWMHHRPWPWGDPRVSPRMLASEPAASKATSALVEGLAATTTAPINRP